VVYIARRFENTGINIEDLISIGTIGLIKAINTYNPDKNIKLATYASRCIENEILMYLRKNAAQRIEVSFDEPLNTTGTATSCSCPISSARTTTSSSARSRRTWTGSSCCRPSGSLPTGNGRSSPCGFGLGGGPEKTQKEVADLLGILQSYISRWKSASSCASGASHAADLIRKAAPGGKSALPCGRALPFVEKQCFSTKKDLGLRASLSKASGK
jgi:RNA polymerase sporulation-specific sigma factor